MSSPTKKNKSPPKGVQQQQSTQPKLILKPHVTTRSASQEAARIAAAMTYAQVTASSLSTSSSSSTSSISPPPAAPLQPGVNPPAPVYTAPPVPRLPSSAPEQDTQNQPVLSQPGARSDDTVVESTHGWNIETLEEDHPAANTRAKQARRVSGGGKSSPSERKAKETKEQSPKEISQQGVINNQINMANSGSIVQVNVSSESDEDEARRKLKAKSIKPHKQAQASRNKKQKSPRKQEPAEYEDEEEEDVDSDSDYVDRAR